MKSVKKHTERMFKKFTAEPSKEMVFTTKEDSELKDRIYIDHITKTLKIPPLIMEDVLDISLNDANGCYAFFPSPSIVQMKIKKLPLEIVVRTSTFCHIFRLEQYSNNLTKLRFKALFSSKACDLEMGSYEYKLTKLTKIGGG